MEYGAHGFQHAGAPPPQGYAPYPSHGALPGPMHPIVPPGQHPQWQQQHHHHVPPPPQQQHIPPAQQHGIHRIGATSGYLGRGAPVDELAIRLKEEQRRKQQEYSQALAEQVRQRDQRKQQEREAKRREDAAEMVQLQPSSANPSGHGSGNGVPHVERGFMDGFGQGERQQHGNYGRGRRRPGAGLDLPSFQNQPSHNTSVPPSHDFYSQQQVPPPQFAHHGGGLMSHQYDAAAPALPAPGYGHLPDVASGQGHPGGGMLPFPPEGYGFQPNPQGFPGPPCFPGPHGGPSFSDPQAQGLASPSRHTGWANNEEAIVTGPGITPGAAPADVQRSRRAQQQQEMQDSLRRQIEEKNRLKLEAKRQRDEEERREIAKFEQERVRQQQEEERIKEEKRRKALAAEEHALQQQQRVLAAAEEAKQQRRQQQQHHQQQQQKQEQVQQQQFLQHQQKQQHSPPKPDIHPHHYPQSPKRLNELQRDPFANSRAHLFVDPPAPVAPQHQAIAAGPFQNSRAHQFEDPPMAPHQTLSHLPRQPHPPPQPQPQQHAPGLDASALQRQYDDMREELERQRQLVDQLHAQLQQQQQQQSAPQHTGGVTPRPTLSDLERLRIELHEELEQREEQHRQELEALRRQNPPQSRSTPSLQAQPKQRQSLEPPHHEEQQPSLRCPSDRPRHTTQEERPLPQPSPSRRDAKPVRKPAKPRLGYFCQPGASFAESTGDLDEEAEDQTDSNEEGSGEEEETEEEGPPPRRRVPETAEPEAELQSTSYITSQPLGRGGSIAVQAKTEAQMSRSISVTSLQCESHLVFFDGRVGDLSALESSPGTQPGRVGSFIVEEHDDEEARCHQENPSMKKTPSMEKHAASVPSFTADDNQEEEADDELPAHHAMVPVPRASVEKTMTKAGQGTISRGPSEEETLEFFVKRVSGNEMSNQGPQRPLSSRRYDPLASSESLFLSSSLRVRSLRGHDMTAGQVEALILEDAVDGSFGENAHQYEEEEDEDEESITGAKLEEIFQRNVRRHEILSGFEAQSRQRAPQAMHWQELQQLLQGDPADREQITKELPRNAALVASSRWIPTTLGPGVGS